MGEACDPVRIWFHSGRFWCELCQDNASSPTPEMTSLPGNERNEKVWINEHHISTKQALSQGLSYSPHLKSWFSRLWFYFFPWMECIQFSPSSISSAVPPTLRMDLLLEKKSCFSDTESLVSLYLTLYPQTVSNGVSTPIPSSFRDWLPNTCH